MPPEAPPHSPGALDLAEVWRRAAAAVRPHRIALPPYAGTGLLFTVGANGTVGASRAVPFHDGAKVRAAVEALLGRPARG